MHKIFLSLVFLFYSPLMIASQFSNGEIVLSYDLEKGRLYDDGDISWEVNYCHPSSSYSCFFAKGYWFGVAIPKRKILLGDHWYFSGFKFRYVANLGNNNILISFHVSKDFAKKYSWACSTCVSFAVVKDKLIIVSMITTYETNDRSQPITVDQWTYSEGNFYLNKIPKGFPSEQIYSINEVEKRLKADWVPD